MYCFSIVSILHVQWDRVTCWGCQTTCKVGMVISTFTSHHNVSCTGLSIWSLHAYMTGLHEFVRCIVMCLSLDSVNDWQSVRDVPHLSPDDKWNRFHPLAASERDTAGGWDHYKCWQNTAIWPSPQAYGIIVGGAGEHFRHAAVLHTQ